MLNALKYAEELEKAGFTHEQAETSVKVIFEVMTQNFATKSDLKELEFATRADIKALEFATRADIKELEQSTKADIKELEFKMKEFEHKVDLRFSEMEAKTGAKFLIVDSKFQNLENRLTIKLGAMQAASVALIVALLKLL